MTPAQRTELITLLQRLDPADWPLAVALTRGFLALQETGNPETLHAAFRAFEARVAEKQRIANN